MADQTTTSSPRSRTSARTPQLRAAAAAGAAVVLLVAVFALADPSGLLAPIGGHGLPILGTGGAFAWAPLLVGLPILLAGVLAPVFVTARAGRPVFFATWAATVGAVAVAAAVSGILVALPVAGAHLGVVDTVQFAFATSGFAGLKGLVVGPLVGLAAVLGARGRTRKPRRPGRPRLALGAMLAVMSVAAVGFASTSWRGGSVGYAFVGPLVAPTVSAGVLGTLAGFAVFGGAFFVAVRRWGTAGVVAAVWLSSVAAGVALGVVDAVVAAIAHAGSDAWWFATTVVSLATGIGYGVSVGLIAT
ncbi:MAG: hypothetical protein AAGC49_15725, partial [Brevundimonas sp.]